MRSRLYLPAEVLFREGLELLRPQLLPYLLLKGLVGCRVPESCAAGGASAAAPATTDEELCGLADDEQQLEPPPLQRSVAPRGEANLEIIVDRMAN